MRRSLRFQSKVQTGKDLDLRKQSITDELRSETKKKTITKPSGKGSEASLGKRGVKNADLFNKSGNNQFLFSDWLEYEHIGRTFKEDLENGDAKPITKVCFVLQNQGNESLIRF